MLHILVVCQEHVELLLSEPQQIAVLFTGPTCFGNSLDKMIRKFELKLLGETLVEKDPHF
jgi:hypothetical protein